MSSPEEIVTRVARIGWKEHRFRGHRVFEELVSTETFWSLLSIACGGPRLDERLSRLWDTLAACCLAADPRIWPLKLTRLVSAYGGPVSAICATMQLIDTGRLGGSAILASAEFLQEMAHELGDEGIENPAAIEAAVNARFAKKVRFPGYGIPYRPEDERVLGLMRHLEREGFDRGRHFRLALAISPLHKGWLRSGGINIAGAIAALSLDIGLSPEHLLGLCLMIPFAPCLANAVEGAKQRPSVLQRLPRESIEYRGPAPRRSPRRLAKEEKEEEGKG